MRLNTSVTHKLEMDEVDARKIATALAEVLGELPAHPSDVMTYPVYADLVNRGYIDTLVFLRNALQEAIQ